MDEPKKPGTGTSTGRDDDGANDFTDDELISDPELTTFYKDDLVHQLLGYRPVQVAVNGATWAESFRNGVPNGNDTSGTEGGDK